MTSNKSSGSGSLILELNGNSNAYILGSHEIPSLITTDYVQIRPNLRVHKTFLIREIENQPEVRDLAISQRKCRFAEENYLDVYPFYGYSACLVQCRKDAQLRKCGCAHHLMPNTAPEKRCNVTGMDCLSKNYKEVTVQKPKWSNKTGIVCDCLPSCTEIQLFVVKDERDSFSEDYSNVELSLERLPTERYKRNVVKGKMDLTVSIGSAIALFLGASFMSFTEMFYYFLIRPISEYIKRNCQRRHSTHFYRN